MKEEHELTRRGNSTGESPEVRRTEGQNFERRTLYWSIERKWPRGKVANNI